MSCLSALPEQITTFLSVPHEVLFLRHRVFREYVKIAVGPDFIHTFPSFIVLVAMSIVLWKKPPNFRLLFIIEDKTLLYKILQVCFSWIVINGVLWLWLIFQRIIYCSIWSHWNHETELREITIPWWQKVWSTFYPPPSEAPVMSAGFISWIISMLLAVGTLFCALSVNRVGKIIDESSKKFQEILESCNSCCDSISKKFLESILTTEKRREVDENSELSSLCDDRRSEISMEGLNNEDSMEKREIHPISYGTDWTPRPKFSSSIYEKSKEAKKKASMHSLRTTITVDEAMERDEPEVRKFSARQLRNRRGCHTVIPSYSSDKSSGC